jgi:hypothetical protein
MMTTVREIEERLAAYHKAGGPKTQLEIITSMADCATLGLVHAFFTLPAIDNLCSPWGRPMP